ncbi:MAG: flagellin, partial [Planctomycetota bacterium]
AFHVGFGTANAINQISVSLDPVLSTSLALNTLDIGSGGNTSLAIGQVDAAINTVSALRGSLGAIQNRLNSTVRNLGLQVENISAANSRIRDVDVAFETARLTRNSILQQASIAILAQTNAQPQAALALLG